jgi:hypothetical protein
MPLQWQRIILPMAMELVTTVLTLSSNPTTLTQLAGTKLQLMAMMMMMTVKKAVNHQWQTMWAVNLKLHLMKHPNLLMTTRKPPTTWTSTLKQRAHKV